MQGNSQQIIQWLFNQDREKQFEVKEFKQKRSLDSNSYMWVLVTKIAGAMQLSKDIVYIQMLRDYGESLLIPLLPEQEPQGFFQYFEYFGEKEINGKQAIYYKVFKGSSSYNQKQMSVLLDGVVNEANALGIDTMTPNEIARLNESWANNGK